MRVTDRLRIKVLRWALTYEAGNSAKTIVKALTREPVTDHATVPYDAGDFGRCYAMLKRFPELVPHFREVAVVYPEWGPLVDAWRELSQLWEEESPTGKCPKLGQRIDDLVEAGRRKVP